MKKININKLNNNKGIALITSYIVISTLITLSIGFSLSAITELSHARRYRSSSQAFWLAEAGLQKVISLIQDNQEYSSESPVTQDFNTGSYSVSVSRVNDDYTLTSTGIVENLSPGRTLQQTVSVGSQEWSGAFNYALFANGGTVQVKENGTIAGSIFNYGDVNIKENSTVTDYVYATGTITDKPSSDYTEGEIPDPAPTMPVFDTTVYFDPEIANAASEGISGDQFYSGLDLSGGTVYVNGNVQINADSIVAGPGTLVATGDISVMENSWVTEGVTLISGANLQLQEGCTVETGFVLYGETSIQIKENGSENPSGIAITPGDVQIKEYGNYTGIIYAGGAIQIKENSSITGSIVAGASEEEGIQIKEDSYVTYDASLLPESLPPGLEGSGPAEGEIIVSNWEEIAYTP